MATKVVVMLAGQDRDVILDVKYETVVQAVRSGSWLEDTGTTPNLRCSLDPDSIAAVYELNV